MHTNHTNALPWRVEDIDFHRINRKLAIANEDLLLLLCVASFAESGSSLYASNLVRFFEHDAEITEWLAKRWQHEELQHGRALKAYIRYVWPEFDWDTAFKHFFADYARICTFEALEKTRALEMVTRCVIETGTATLYQALHTCSDEPILKEITHYIRTDEVRHYKYFFKYFKKYQAIERNSRLAIFGALARRVTEIKHDDTEIALGYVYKFRYPDEAEASNRKRFRQINARVNALVRHHFPAEMCIKMLLKPLDLPPRLQTVIYYPLAKLTQYLFLR